MVDDPPRRLLRSHDRKVAGVAAGIAEYFDFDPTLVRLAFVAIALVGFVGAIAAYIILWIVMPEAPEGAAPPPAQARSGQAVLVLLAILAVVVLAGGFAWFSVASLHFMRFSLPAWIVLIVLAWLILRERDSRAR